MASKNQPHTHRASYQAHRPTLWGLSSTEWGRLVMFLALVLLLTIGVVFLPTWVGGA